MKSIQLRPLAADDLVTRAHYYRDQGGHVLAQRFFETALKSLRSIERQPGLGSSRIGELCEMPTLRAWPVAGFPVRWFYLERTDHVDVVRLLGDAQDLVTILGE